MSKLRVGLLGSTGLVGQSYVKLLKGHPYFELSFIPMRDECAQVEKAKGCALIFSALPNEVAETVEPLYVQAGFPLFSSASCHRLKEGVSLIIPEINGEILKHWKGGMIAKPNCTLQSMLLPLYPLHLQFRLKSVAVTNLQSMSGAGKDFTLGQNVIPYIEGEEEKSEQESLKILGAPTLPMSIHCTRVPVVHGHLACISASFETKPTLEEVRKCWEAFPRLDLPSSPEKVFRYREENDRPQPLKDVEEGMTITLGRLRSCPLFDIRFTALSHNLMRGAAGGGLLTAEYFAKEHLI
ncbi:MAG: aspartate-semialdehyde dehydrogenase [Chlamydiales bacterium]|nr:aspartate-semialdehyde dehydrogenase [Chlamydiales bacterium]